MTDSLLALIFDLLERVANRKRNYQDVMKAGSNSRARLPARGDENDRRSIAADPMNGSFIVRITSSGLALPGQRRLTSTPRYGERPF